jgi:hypothetical protein
VTPAAEPAIQPDTPARDRLRKAPEVIGVHRSVRSHRAERVLQTNKNDVPTRSPADVRICRRPVQPGIPAPPRWGRYPGGEGRAAHHRSGRTDSAAGPSHRVGGAVEARAGSWAPAARQGHRRLRFEATSDVSAYTKPLCPAEHDHRVGDQVLHLCRSRNAIAMRAASSGNTDGFTIDEVELHFGATARIVGSLATRLKGQNG